MTTLLLPVCPLYSDGCVDQFMHSCRYVSPDVPGVPFSAGPRTRKTFIGVMFRPRVSSVYPASRHFSTSTCCCTRRHAYHAVSNCQWVHTSSFGAVADHASSHNIALKGGFAAMSSSRGHHGDVHEITTLVPGGRR
jgi:hypothetical protein